MIEKTIRQELTPEDVEKLGPHAGHLAKEIDAKVIARKEAMKAAKEEIDALQEQLDQALMELHQGYRLIPAQTEMFNKSESRVDEVRAVVQKAREKARKQNPVDNDLFNQACDLTESEDRVTVSILRRRLGIGKSKAERLMNELVSEGVVTE